MSGLFASATRVVLNTDLDFLKQQVSQALIRHRPSCVLSAQGLRYNAWRLNIACDMASKQGLRYLSIQKGTFSQIT